METARLILGKIRQSYTICISTRSHLYTLATLFGICYHAQPCKWTLPKHLFKKGHKNSLKNKSVIHNLPYDFLREFVQTQNAVSDVNFRVGKK